MTIIRLERDRHFTVAARIPGFRMVFDHDLDPPPAPKDKPGCFRRQSTGERVCPN